MILSNGYNYASISIRLQSHWTHKIALDDFITISVSDR